MPQSFFVNLPVSDLGRSMAFYEAVGAPNNPQFTGDGAACMVFSETLYVMLHEEASWRRFTPKAIPDAHTSAQVLLCMSVDAKADLAATVDKGVAAGGKADPTPAQDFDFMSGRSFEDPDGHIWELVWMNPDAQPPHA